MATWDSKLQVVATQLKKDGVAPPRETVRSFLWWFRAERRGYRVVRLIRMCLSKYGIATIPDFESAYIDGDIGFVAATAEGNPSTADPGDGTADPTYRVSRLESANRVPTSIAPDATLQQAITLMLTFDYSQLPVMTSPREVKGIVSWKTIGERLALKRPCSYVRDCMGAANLIGADETLFSAIKTMVEHDHALVVGSDRIICGIVTASDFNDQFRRLAEPFLLVSEIEYGIRRLLRGKFTVKELESVRDPKDDGRSIQGLADLTFGEYARLLEVPSNWKRLSMELDRAEFVKRVGEVRNIRNDVMHFDPDGLDDGDLKVLRDFAILLKHLRDVGAM